MLADYHVHTEFSDDSTEPMENVIRRAISLGVKEICFTDHVDYGIKIDHDIYRRLSKTEQEKAGILLNVDYPAYFKQIAELKIKYQDRVTIRQGLEFGMQVHSIPAYQNIFDTYPLDFVILSCHQADDKEFWNHDFQKGKSPEEYNARYYQEIYNCILRYQDYSVLGHLDMIQRYNDPPYPFEASKEIITKILMQVIADGKGIEVNTSSFRYGLADRMPARGILELYYDLGGKIITIGSDCHKADDLCDHVADIQKELRTIGFTAFCTFEKMLPVFHDLPLF